MLEIKNINCSIKDSDIKILEDFSLKINSGEVHVIMGPNGTGKSTLSKAIMGHYKYEVNAGDIILDGESILDLDVDERAKRGLFLCMQDPTVIEGVSNSEFLRTARGSITGSKVNLYTFIKDMESAMSDVGLDSNMLHRSLNMGFSGGEKKKNEILQMLVLNPKLVILDETDSGLDVDAIRTVSKGIEMFKTDENAVLIITHNTKILSSLDPDYVHVLVDGKIVKTGTKELAKEIEEKGYSEFKKI